ncbi:ATP-binding cassette sub- G member 2 [Thoreauomyces humboldtii]|nr:ATP-binding cassette sub- G member 2 [Thoreauomyces humboldtii]
MDSFKTDIGAAGSSHTVLAIEDDTDSNQFVLTGAGLEWKNLSYEIDLPGKKQGSRIILNGISGTARRGEMVAILGASGAGKTTLLNCLSGRVPSGRLSGKITLDSRPRDPHTWKRNMAFVEQDDDLLGHLTVLETLTYAARLRLPEKTLAQQRARALTILETLRLQKAANTTIGTELTRGVSGGERKRCAIGVSLVGGPSVLALDEGTSGLDSTAAFSVLSNVAQDAAKSGRVVVVTIHQPSLEILALFAQIVVLCAGKVAFMGTVDQAISHFESIGYPLPIHRNPADHFMDIVTVQTGGGAEEDARIAKIQDAYARIEVERGSQSDEKSSDLTSITTPSPDAAVAEPPSSSATVRNSWIVEFGILFSREWLGVTRARSVRIAELVRTIVLIVLIGVASLRLAHDQRGLQNRIGVLFTWPVNSMFVTLQPIVISFPLALSKMIRERSSGLYRVSTFFAATALSILIPVIFFALLAIVPLYWIIGLQPDVSKFFIWIGINLLVVICGAALGLAVAAGARTVQLAQAIGPLCAVLFMLYGGMILNTQRLGWWFRWIHYLSPIGYGFSALAQNELAGATFSCLPGEACVPNGDDSLKVYNLDEISIGLNAVALAALAAAFFLLGYVLLRRTSKPKAVVLR